MRRARYEYDIPPVAPQYRAINRYLDPHTGYVTAKLVPGQLYLCDHSELITAVTGGCLTVCASDSWARIGGMAQFLVPPNRALPGAPGYDPRHRRGLFMMERLIRELMRHGAHRDTVRVKMFGGAVIAPEFADACQATIRMAKEYLRTEGIIVDKSDLGLLQPRKVLFFPDSGRVLVKRLGVLRNNTLLEREREYLQRVQSGSDRR